MTNNKEAKAVMIAQNDLANSRRTFYIRLDFEHFAYMTLSREEFEKAAKAEIEAASNDALEMIMKDHDEPKSS